MSYILIFVWYTSYGHGTSTSVSTEFKTKEACQSAADEILKQARSESGQVKLILCAAKG